MKCAVCKGSGWSPNPMFVCGSGGCSINRVVCDACFGSGRSIENKPLFRQRMGRVLKAHRQKHGESVFQETRRLGLDIIAPKIIMAIERGKMTPECAYTSRFARRAAQVTARMFGKLAPDD